MMQMFFFLILNDLAVGTLTYVYGDCMDFHSGSTKFPSFSCSSNAILTTTIPFNDTFLNTPQVILFVNYYDTPKGYKLSTGDIQKTEFQVKLECPTASTGVYFFWIAIDDKRITVNNTFNQVVAGPTTTTYYFTHNNPFVTQAFAGVTSFYSTGAFDINLQVSIFNTTTVEAVFSTTSTLLTNVGFFVVTGTAEAFTQASLQTLTAGATGTIYTSSDLAISKTNGIMIFVPIVNFHWTYTSQQIRIRTNYTLTDTDYQYNLNLWANSKYQSFSFKEITFNFHNYKVLTPFLCKKMKISKKYSKSLDSNTIKIYHTEESKFYYSGDTQPFDYTPGTQTFTISIFIQCKQSTKTYSVKVLKCFSCTNQYHTLNLNCYGSINMMQHDIYYQQTDLVYQKLSLSLTDTTISLTQTAVTPSDAILLDIQKI